jgi:hypothetical protein
MMGAIPIVLNSTISSLYTDMNIMVINNWSDVNEANLKVYEKTIRFDASEIPTRKKLWAKYWADLVLQTNAAA